ncbi:MAG: hypothetical protein V3V10_05325 [Planctomycetota bacterium]
MKTKEHTITLHSPESLAGRLPLDIGRFLTLTGELSQKSVRLHLEGTSSGRGGRKPKWLEDATDVRLLGYKSNGNGLTTFGFEAPILGECTPDDVWQRQLFESNNNQHSDTNQRSDTPLDWVADAIDAINEQDRDSVLFDHSLLSSCKKFGNALGCKFDKAAFAGSRISKDSPVVADSVTFEVAESLDSSTPKPQAVRVLGVLDMLHYSQSKFSLKVNGSQVPCVLLPDQIKELSEFGNTDVIVQGKAVYRPSGKLLRIEVDHFENGKGQSEVWRKSPVIVSGISIRSKYRKPQGPRSGVNAFFGTWPGDETEEEFLAAITGRSK